MMQIFEKYKKQLQYASLMGLIIMGISSFTIVTAKSKSNLGETQWCTVGFYPNSTEYQNENKRVCVPVDTGGHEGDSDNNCWNTIQNRYGPQIDPTFGKQWEKFWGYYANEGLQHCNQWIALCPNCDSNNKPVTAAAKKRVSPPNVNRPQR